MKRQFLPKGFSLIELLISMGILAVIMAALGSLFLSTNKNYATQNEMINLQENARSTLYFITRPLRNGISPVTITGTSPNNTLFFYAIEDIGRSTGGNSSTTLIDSTKSSTWTSSQWQNCYVYIQAGTGMGQTKQISSNSTTQLTISGSWTTTPDNTSDYQIRSSHFFSLSGTNLQYSKNGGTAATLSDHITGLTAQLSGTTRVDLILSAQSANIRQDTGQTQSVSLDSSVTLKN